MKTKEQLHKITLTRGLKPLPKISVRKWADTYRQLSSGISAEPGRWKTSRTPYAAEPMEAVTQHGIHRIVLKWCAQAAKSEIMNNIIGRFAHVDPCVIMMIQPTIEMANDFSKMRITNMIKDTKVLTPLFFDLKDSAKTRDSNQTILSKVFPGGRLIFCGANSPAGLASRPVRILLCDEVDRFPRSASTEGDPIDIASKRMSTFWNNLMVMCSTPTIEGESRIDIEYITGTQEEWRHRCPNCGEYHTLHYKQMISDYQEVKDESGHKVIVVKSVLWRCPDCGRSFDELTIKNAPQKYVALNPEAAQNGIRSFYVNGFSSPWLTWSGIMREWLEAQGRPEREQVVINTRFGLSYQLAGAFADEIQFLSRCEEYGAELPDGVLLLTAAVDVQDNRLEYEICGWSESEECYGIIRGVITGQPDNSYVWRKLDEALDRKYHLQNGTPLKVVRTFIDSGGHFTSEVYKYCRDGIYKQRIAIKGQGGAGVPLVSKVTLLKEGIPLQLLGVNEGKQQVFSRLGIKKVGAQYFHFPKDDEYLGLRGYDQIYFKQLIAEHKVTHKSGGQIYSMWEPVSKHARNESLDLRVYNLAVFKSCKPHIDWRLLKESLTGEKTPEVEKTASAPKAALKSKKYAHSKSVDIWS